MPAQYEDAAAIHAQSVSLELGKTFTSAYCTADDVLAIHVRQPIERREGFIAALS